MNYLNRKETNVERINNWFYQDKPAEIGQEKKTGGTTKSYQEEKGKNNHIGQSDQMRTRKQGQHIGANQCEHLAHLNHL